MSRRYFDNPYPDFSSKANNDQIIDVENKTIHPAFVDKLKSMSHKFLGVLEEQLDKKSRDGSVYTGTAGSAFLYLMLADRLDDKKYLGKSCEFAENSLNALRKRDVTFMCGDGGPLAIAAILYHKLNKAEQSKKCVSKLLALAPRVVALDGELPDELLYGRVGFLYCLLLLNHHIPDTVPGDLFTQVVTSVVESGRNMSLRENLEVPLMYEWYGERYLGGAHGVAGIMYLLLQAKQYLTADQLGLIRPTIDFLLERRYRSGNFPSSLGSDSDRLVHWCHGAPGTIQALCAAYEVFGDPKYLQAATQCGDVVWERGLLRKGYGICHGVAGNAYTFLSLYQQTGELKHLYRACRFAEWCFSYNKNQDREPDRPYSLFEGLAGTVYFLFDLQNPLSAKFPGFTV